MMIAYKLVRVIEAHSASLAGTLLERVQNSEMLTAYRNVPASELKDRVYEIYRHLGQWLLGSSDFDIENRYLEIGTRRAHQEVPISQLVWTILLTKEVLWEFLKDEAAPDRPMEVSGELELLQLLDQFFDRAIYYAALGHERAFTPRGVHEVTASRGRS